MQKRYWFWLCSFLSVGTPQLSRGAGVAIYEVSTRGSVLGGALVGSTLDASATYYNPANLTECAGTQIMAGSTALSIVTDATVDGRRQGKMNSGWYPPSFGYVSQELTDDLYAGFGFFSEFGLGTHDASDWALRAAHTSAEIEGFTFAPALAYRLTDKLSVGASLRLMCLTFETHKRPNLRVPGSEFDAKVDGESFGVGGKFGITYKITDDLSAGITYTTRVRHNLDGDATFREGVPGVGPIPATPAYSTKSHANVDLPSSVSMGLNYDLTKKWRTGVAAIWTEWSTLQSLSFHFNENPTPPVPAIHDNFNGSDLDLRWKDVWRFGWGTEYDVTETWTLMGGYVYDFDPSQNNPSLDSAAMLPPGDRHCVGLGASYAWGRWTFTAGYSLIMNHPETIHGTSAGVPHTLQYDNGFAHALSFSVGVKF